MRSPAATAPTAHAGDGAPSRWRRLAGAASWPHGLLAALVVLYVAVFGFLTWRQQRNFGTFGFDMGIYDQGIWLLSQGQSPFVTVRGMQYFGHHVNVITVLFVPFYRLGAGPEFLYLVETVWLAAGALPVWLLARDKLGSEWAATTLAGAYLLYPSVEWVNWWHFHPDALIITPLLFAVWLASRERWRWFAVAVMLALLCKEDAGLAVFGLGVMLAVRRQWRAGLLTALAGIGWFFFATQVVIPQANGGVGAFYDTWFPGFGSTLPEVVGTMLRHPERVVEVLTRPDRLEYYLHLLVPVAFIALASPTALLIGLPQLVVNSMSGHSYTHDARYHYTSVIVASIFVATVEGCARLGRTRLPKAVPVVVVAVAALASNVVLSPSPIGREFDSGVWAIHNPRAVAMREAVNLVPPGAGVSATYFMVPHLTHRTRVYEFPNPWRQQNWGVDGENPADPAGVDYIVVDTGVLGSDAALFNQLVAPGGGYQVRYKRDGIAVAVRGGAVWPQ